MLSLTKLLPSVYVTSPVSHSGTSVRSGVTDWTSSVTCRQSRRGSVGLSSGNRLVGLMAEVSQDQIWGWSRMPDNALLGHQTSTLLGSPFGKALQSAGWLGTVLDPSSVCHLFTSMTVETTAHKLANRQEQNLSFWMGRPLASYRVLVSG